MFEQPGMVSSQMADADDAHTDGRAHRSLPADHDDAVRVGRGKERVAIHHERAAGIDGQRICASRASSW